MRSKTETVAGLRRMLNEMLAARERGESAPRLSRTQGYMDGYMRALLDSGQVTRQELLEIVAVERARVSGPATAEIHPASLSA
ncbi:hypothetical protein SOCEGT47_032780 [Sorangium cellulosum]|uniref:Uncharacterized protein n=1 Tax=Sorangium cellulosum TaxID=56 RepID=A0A4P2Q1E8_SORCE|nr:hypothetical protein [Sorangium cellulosum]AUX22768.1 hypothetical protein SOCEGT47_032780 [Sorangium cellulosum]